MSANNYLLISKSQYTVKECDADTEYCSVKYEGCDLEDALDKADEIMKEEIIEYGVQFEK